MIIYCLLMLGVMLGITIAAGDYAPPTLPRFIRERDVIAQWGVSKATLIRARKKGLPFVRLGAYICYKPSDLEAHFCQPRSWNAANPKGTEDEKDG